MIHKEIKANWGFGRVGGMATWRIVLLTVAAVMVSLWLSLLVCSWGVASAIQEGRGDGLSLEQFRRIKPGMTDLQVKQILGPVECNVMSEVVLMGTRTVMYMCPGRGVLGANANYTIQGGKVTARAQFGLE